MKRWCEGSLAHSRALRLLLCLSPFQVYRDRYKPQSGLQAATGPAERVLGDLAHKAQSLLSPPVQLRL